MGLGPTVDGFWDRNNDAERSNLLDLATGIDTLQIFACRYPVPVIFVCWDVVFSV